MSPCTHMYQLLNKNLGNGFLWIDIFNLKAILSLFVYKGMCSSNIIVMQPFAPLITIPSCIVTFLRRWLYLQLTRTLEGPRGSMYILYEYSISKASESLKLVNFLKKERSQLSNRWAECYGCMQTVDTIWTFVQE